MEAGFLSVFPSAPRTAPATQLVEAMYEQMTPDTHNVSTIRAGPSASKLRPWLSGHLRMAGERDRQEAPEELIVNMV